MDKQLQIQGKNLAKNAAFHTVYQILNVLFPLITATYVSRVLAPEGVGKVAYAQNIVSYFLMFAVLGIPNYGTREIASKRNDPTAVNKLFTELLVINTVSTALSAACFYAAAFCGLFGEPTVFVVCGTQLLFNLINIDWFYQGEEEYVYITIRSLLVKVLSLAAIFIFVRDPGDYATYALISCMGIGGNNIFNVYHARKRIKLEFKNLSIRKHVKPILILALSTVIGSLYTKVDVTMLGALCSEEIVGYYTNAQKVVSLGLTVVVAISAVFMPRLSYLYHQDRPAFEKLVSIGLKIVLLLAVPCWVGLTLVAESLTIAAFGPLFQPAVMAIQIMAVKVLVMGVGDLLCYQTIISSGNEHVLLKSRLIAGIANIILNAILIPKFMHIGAAIASVISEVLVNGVVLRQALRIVTPKVPLRFLGSVLAGTVLMGISVIVIQSVIDRPIISLVISVLVGVVSYFVVQLALENELMEIVIRVIEDKRRNG